MIWTSKYFCGNKISAYGLENGYVDYRTLAASFDAVLNNEIMGATNYVVGEWEQENGFVDYSDEIDEIREEIREEIEALEEKRDTIEEKASDFCNVCTCDCKADTYCEYERTRKKVDEIEAEIANKEEEIERLEEEQDNEPEIFQWYIISDSGANILKSYTNEIVYYNSVLDMYLWGITHSGTAWDYVLTDIRIKLDDDENDD